MRSPRLGLVAALEAEQELEAALDIGLGNNATGVETAMLDIGELEAEFTSAEVDNSNIVEITEALESISIALEASGQSLNKSGAQILNITLNSLYGVVGIVNRQSSIATESLDNKDCLNYSKVALEGITDGIAKIWEAIIAAIKKSMEWVKDFFNKLFGINKKIEEKIVELEEKIVKKKEEQKSSGPTTSKDWPGDINADPKDNPTANVSSKQIGYSPTQQKETRFVNPNIFKNLQIDGKFPSSISSEMSKYEKITEDILFKVDAIVYKYFNNALKQIKPDASNLDSTLVFSKLDFGSILKPMKDGFVYQGLIRVASEKSFGDTRTYAFIPENEVTGVEGIKLLKHMDFGVDSPFDSTGNIKEIPYLTLDECVELVSKLKSVVALTTIKDANITKITVFKEEAIKLADASHKFFKQNRKEGEKYNGTNAHSIREFITTATKLIDKLNIKYLIRAKNINSAILHYIDVSMAQI